MQPDCELLYAQRLNRYVTAMRGGKPDRIPIRPLAAEFAAVATGYDCQQVTHDYQQGFEAVIECCRRFDWDAVVPNMVYVWTGLTQAASLRYYATPGIEVGADVGFQYREPPEDGAWMRREEYDDLIADPVRFLYEVWLPRVSGEFGKGGYRERLALVKSAWAMANYFNAFGPQIERMRRETGTVSAISGMLKAPLDVLADKFRGYVGLAFDLKEIPEKVLAACHALMPHLAHIALSGLDPARRIPIPIWMHRGCVPFISMEHFHSMYWATLKPIVEAIWARGNQVLFYAEGKWDAHLEEFAKLPAGSIVFHLDRTDCRKAREHLGGRFCLSGGVPNALLTLGTPDQVKAKCKELIDLLGRDGGYIMDASAIMQNDARVENVRAMTEFTRDYGNYGGALSSAEPPGPPAVRPAEVPLPRRGTTPGVCLPWEQKLKELPAILGDAGLARRVWEDVDGLGYFYIWHLVLSF